MRIGCRPAARAPGAWLSGDLRQQVAGDFQRFWVGHADSVVNDIQFVAQQVINRAARLAHVAESCQCCAVIDADDAHVGRRPIWVAANVEAISSAVYSEEPTR